MKKLLFFLLFVPMVSLGQTGDVETYSKTGDAKANLKDHYGAISDYTKAIELDPGHGPSYYNRGLSKLNLNNNSGAISDFTKAIELYKTWDRIYYVRGFAKHNLKDYEGAISDFTKAIELNPNNPDNYSFRAIIKTLKNDSSGACSDFKKAASLGSEDDAKNFKKYCGGVNSSISSNLSSTERVITGVVSDLKGVPLLGAIVNEVGTNNSTMTDFDGNYSIKVKPGQTLKFGWGTCEKFSKVSNKDYRINISIKAKRSCFK